jgi:hypothetical protein
MLAMTNVLAIANALANRTSTFNDLTEDDEVQLALSCTHRRDSLQLVPCLIMLRVYSTEGSVSILRSRLSEKVATGPYGLALAKSTAI